MFLLPWKILPSSGKKYADAHVPRQTVLGHQKMVIVMDRQTELYSVLWVENHWSNLFVLGAKRSYLELSSSELRWFLKVSGNIQTT